MVVRRKCLHDAVNLLRLARQAERVEVLPQGSVKGKAAAEELARKGEEDLLPERILMAEVLADLALVDEILAEEGGDGLGRVVDDAFVN